MADFDVVMPVRNGATTVARAISSILTQNEENWQLYIVDDGSTDSTRAVISEFEDARIQVLDSSANGPAAARNCGLAAGSSQFVAFLDSDDEVRPGWLTSLRPPDGVGLMRCGSTLIRPGRENYEIGATEVPLLAGTFVVRRDILQAIGGYDDQLLYSENTDLSLRLDDQLNHAGLNRSTVERSLAIIYQDSDRSNRYSPVVLRDASERMLSKHESRWERQADVRASYHAIAGVNSLRLGEAARARVHLRTAVRLAPRRWRYRIRLAQAHLRRVFTAASEA